MNSSSFFARAVCIGVSAVLFAAPHTVQASPAVPSNTQAQTPAVGRLLIHLLVPEKKDCVDSFIIYPYPVKPPTNEKKLKPLPNTMKKLRAALFNDGYAARVAANKVYPPNGWRWRYIFQTAAAKNGEDFPHGVVSAYVWVDNVVPYAIPEIKKVNAAERRRIIHYDKAVEFWDLNSVDIENAATQAGRYPYEIAFDKKNWVARARLPEGMWWVVGTHRISGLVFYWQEPVKIVDGKLSTVNLDEWNALVVQGAW